jgi:hypothetical protein
MSCERKNRKPRGSREAHFWNTDCEAGTREAKSNAGEHLLEVYAPRSLSIDVGGLR